MTLWQAILMAVIQGLTEFFPVSSSGHLALFQILFGVEADAGLLYDVLLHVGTLAAVCIVYRRDVARMAVAAFQIARDACGNVAIFFRGLGKEGAGPYHRIVSSSYRKLVVLIVVSTIPTGVIGFFGRDVVEAASQILLVPGICLCVTAALLFLSDRAKEGDKLPRQTTYTDAFEVGIAQGIATLPGLSRSGTTIAVCLFHGYRRSYAVKYSFLMSIPAILGALVLELADIGSLSVTPAEVAVDILGMAIAAAVGFVCIKVMLAVVREKKFAFFAAYCLIVGAASIAGYFYMM